MAKKLSKAASEKIQEQLDQLRDLKLQVTDPKKAIITIHGGVTNVTFHAKHGQPQNVLFFPAMMKALKETINENITQLESQL